MRLGLRKTIFQQDTEWSRARSLYGGAEVIEERHRHRYEINPKLVETMEKAGLHFVGKDETGERMEIFELRDHPYFVGMHLWVLTYYATNSNFGQGRNSTPSTSPKSLTLA